MNAPARTIFEKIWEAHLITEGDDGEELLYVDRCLIHEGSRHAFDRMAREGQSVLRPEQVFAFSDHYAPTRNRHLGIQAVNQPAIRAMIELLEANAARHGFELFGIDHRDHGILHVVPPELGLTQPGLLMVGADSHTSTHGAFGAIAFGIGASETRHVLTTQTLWQRRPKTMRINLRGAIPFGIGAKDLILATIAQIGVGGATGHAIEYAGDAVSSLSMEARMTLCNMSIEAGARAGLVAPDSTTIEYLKGRRYAPRGEDWTRACAFWEALVTEPDAAFSTEHVIDVARVAPMVTWGTSPEQAAPIDGVVPDPAQLASSVERSDCRASLDYMGLEPGTRLDAIAVDRVFIGSCTNSRIEDLRAAAAVAERGKTKVPAWVVPGSQSIKRQAESEGLDKIFQAAGFEWRDPGCSLCTAINGDELSAGERCASTSNRNFKGRQGRGGRTHLLSPAMAAAAALTGRLCDVRQLGP